MKLGRRQEEVLKSFHNRVIWRTDSGSGLANFESCRTRAVLESLVRNGLAHKKNLKNGAESFRLTPTGRNEVNHVTAPK